MFSAGHWHFSSRHLRSSRRRQVSASAVRRTGSPPACGACVAATSIGSTSWISAADGPGELVVQFSHPLCTDCRELESRFHAEGRHVVTVDVSKSPELARKYGVAVVPTAFAVGADGTVAHRLAG